MSSALFHISFRVGVPFLVIVLSLTGLDSSASSPTLHFAGLERLYFERVTDPGARSVLHSDEVRSLLPDWLPSAARHFEAYETEETQIAVQDFRLPILGLGKDSFLRQVIDRSHRIPDQWWALYEGGKRVECWFFSPRPDRTDGKLLAPIEITDVVQPIDGEMILRTCGSMFRPGGAWWWQGKDLTFSVSEGEIRLRHVLTRFYIDQGPDSGEGPQPGLGVITERMAGPTGDKNVEVRRVDSVPSPVLEQCGYRDPLLEEDDLSCFEMEHVARCITSRPGASVSYRRLDELTFIERGGPTR